MWIFEEISIIREATYFSVILRILVAAVLGGFMGLERGLKNRAAGLRTYMLVCVGACLIMLTNQFIFQTYVQGDPVRMGAQVISGIGFLGAGAIIQDKGKVRGLTTAASLWVVAAIGLAVGAGMYLTAISTTFFLFLILSVFAKLEEKTMRKTKAKAEKARHHDEMEEVILCMENAEDDSIDLKCIE